MTGPATFADLLTAVVDMATDFNLLPYIAASFIVGSALYMFRRGTKAAR